MLTNKVTYWVATTLVLLMAGLGGLADIFQVEAIRESTQGIGFPLYVLPFFGTLKILGSLAIIVPALSRFREAAYAGFIFYFIGAVYCHIAVGDGIDKIAPPLFILAMVILSYLSMLKVKAPSPIQ